MAETGALSELIEPEVKALGYELVRVTFTGGTSDRTLQIMAERPDTRQLDLGDCEKISRRLSEMFDTLEAEGRDPVEGGYRLEVSSPGSTARSRGQPISATGPAMRHALRFSTQLTDESNIRVLSAASKVTSSSCRVRTATIIRSRFLPSPTPSCCLPTNSSRQPRRSAPRVPIPSRL